MNQVVFQAVPADLRDYAGLPAALDLCVVGVDGCMSIRALAEDDPLNRR